MESDREWRQKDRSLSRVVYELVPKEEEAASRPDYSEVNTNEKVQRLVASGELVPLLLLPEAFGGTPIRENTTYVPPYAAELKRDFDQNVIMPLAAERKVTHYRADPEYAGRR